MERGEGSPHLLDSGDGPVPFGEHGCCETASKGTALDKKSIGTHSRKAVPFGDVGAARSFRT